jgi:protein involved in polysaccharide export with SLBB domain
MSRKPSYIISYKSFDPEPRNQKGEEPITIDAQVARSTCPRGARSLFVRIAMFAQFAPRAFALLAFVVTLSACASGAPAMPQGSADPLPQTTEYRLGPGDKLRVSVFNREELTGEFTVGTQGRISYPLIGEVDAAGRTVPQFTTQLTEQLRNGYVRDPIVSVEIAQYRPFFILGEVNRPGAYPYSPGMTVMGAVATAGGFTYRANSRRVFVQRPGQTGEESYPLTSSTLVQPGETVRIPERLF